MVTVWAPLIDGILLGGLYASFVLAFSLVWGVMKIINLFHGELVMLGAFVTFYLTIFLGIDPIITIPFSFVVLFTIGFIIQRGILNRLIGTEELNTLLATYGLSLFIANFGLVTWGGGGEWKNLRVSYGTINLADISFSTARIITFVFSIISIVLLYVFLHRTKLGKAIRATSQDHIAASLMGINVYKVYAVTFGICAGITGIAGTLVSTLYSIHPYMGDFYTTTAFTASIIGGLGYLPGALIGAFILGLTVSYISTYWSVSWVLFMEFLIMYLILVLRPKGILGKGR